MKRNAKIIALAAALALCLLMTGCYVPPDDVNNGGETNSGNNLPFQTLQPTATVTMTPDTVVVETPQTTQGQQGQNIFPDTSTPTPTPGQGGDWTDWGNTRPRPRRLRPHPRPRACGWGSRATLCAPYSGS